MMETTEDILKTFRGPFHPYVFGMVKAARELILEVMPDTIEQVDPSANLIAYGTDRTYKGLICGIVVHMVYINLMFARGAELVDYDHLLRGTGKHARHIRIQFDEDLYFPGVRHLLKAALALHRGM